MNELKLQIAIGMLVTFVVGTAFGLYLSSLLIGSFLEVAK